MTPPPWEGPIRRYPEPFRPAAPPTPLGNAGGYSGARLWRIEAPAGPLVLRLWPVDGPDRPALEMIHGWLREARDLPFLPVPIPALDGRTLVEIDGRSWELAPWLPGRADAARPSSTPRVRAIFAALAAFHRKLGARPVEGPSPGLLARLSETERLLAGDFEAIAAAIQRAPADPHSPTVARWLARARALAPGLLAPIRAALSRPLPLQPVLRDARADHFLLGADRLTGLVDFGAMGRDTVAADLARLLADAVGPDRPARAEALSAYESVRPLQAAESLAIPIFERANALLAPAHWARWHFLERRRFDDPDAVGRGLRRGLERLDEELGSPTRDH